VRFSVARFKDHKHAAGYVTAYLTKHPAHGYPAWIDEMPVGSVRRFEPSRGFWTEQHEPEGEGQEDLGPGADQEDPETIEAEPDDEQRRRTIAEQLASCGQSCVVLRACEAVDPTTGELVTVREFVTLLHVPLGTFTAAVPPDEMSPRRTVALFLDVGRAVAEARRWAARVGSGTMEHSDLEDHEGEAAQRRQDVGDHREGRERVRG
jgi:hypothetical protein